MLKDYSKEYYPEAEIQVIKKDGKTKEPFNVNKIILAVGKSAYRALIKFTEEEEEEICSIIVNEINERYPDSDTKADIPINTIHSMVELALDKVKPIVAKSYKDYRNYKQDFVEMLDSVYKKSQSIMYIGDKENANTDSALVATKRSLVFNQLNKELYKKFFLTAEENQACKDGYIYVHDMSARRDTMNCCLADIKAILTGGFEMGNIWYNDPKTLDVAFDVIGDIVMSAASQQYGGFTLPEVDKILAPYAQKSYDKYVKKYTEKCHMEQKEAEELALEDVAKEMEQGFQGWEYKFNTVGSSRGDYPFITITLGLGTEKFEKLASITALNVRAGGQGKKDHKKPVLFPKVVFLYDEKIHWDENAPAHDVFETGVKCSMKTMYPDWLSMSGEGYISSMYKKYGAVISPMGCESGEEVITYKLADKLYIESFERFWRKISSIYPVLHQPCDNGEGKYLYIDLAGKNVRIYDTQEGFVEVKKLIRNFSTSWNTVKMTNGRNWLCTTDHPFEIIGKGQVLAKDLAIGDKVLINNSSYSEENVVVTDDYAWLLGFLLCDGCYQNSSVFASIALNGEDEIENKFNKLFEEYFGLKVKTVKQYRGEKGYYKDLKAIGEGNEKLSSVINKLTDIFGGIQKKYRHIPNEVFSWNYSAKMAFLAGMIDADGHVVDNSRYPKSRINTVEIGSTNKELAIQQMYLAQTLGMPAKIYMNHYNKNKPNKIRYQVSFFAISELANYIACEKKKTKIYETESASNFECYAQISEIIPESLEQFSYDVETASSHFECSGVYSHNCRAFLSPWYEKGGMYPADENDKPVFVGRFNIGAVSLHLPMILAKARQESKDFYEVLDHYLQLIRQLHIRTYNYLGEMKASTNPLMYCEGGFYGGHLNPGDKIKPLLKPMTASFGITALNELQELYNGKSIAEDGQFALDTLKYINDKVNEFKQEDGILYAIYGTPAENLCGLQVQQFRKKYGVIEGVSDREYVSNSFHCHVTEDITPIQKQDLEGRFWELCNGGKIQYVKYPINYNEEAVKTLIHRAMQKGFYEGVNLSLAYCDDCGHEELEMDVCPICGSKNLTKIDRMNGYLAYSRVHGDTRLNQAKMAEIKDRKSM